MQYDFCSKEGVPYFLGGNIAILKNHIFLLLLISQCYEIQGSRKNIILKLLIIYRSIDR